MVAATLRAVTDSCLVSAWRRVDQVLFEDTAWFVLDSGNQRVPGVIVTCRAEADRLIGTGAVATVVGRLRPGFKVVDVDLPAVLGDACVELLARWCRQRGLWHVVRPSGGGDGRWHLFVAVGDVEEGLADYVEELRGRFGVSPREVDLRTAVRPLTAPHRGGTCPPPQGDAEDVWRSLRSLAAAAVPAGAGRPERRRAPASRAAEPRWRPRRPLSPTWAHYLATGRTPALPGAATPGHGRDYSRSTIEAIATAEMVRAGWSCAEAWEAVCRAHPGAMSKARGSRRRWVSAVWNRAVADNDQAAPAVTARPVDVVVAEAHQRLRRLVWSLRPRQRQSVQLVGLAVLDRVVRTGRTRVPVPERDLVLDAGISDRKTIRAALAALDGQVGTLHRCFDPTRPDASSHEFELTAAPGSGAVSQIPPPSRHTPLPPAGQGVPRGLPHLILRHLHLSPTALTPADLSHLCQLGPSPTAAESPRVRRRVLAALRELLEAGLASCDGWGGWVSTLTADHDAAPDARATAEAEAIARERQAYRESGARRWNAERAAALKRQAAREKAWWEALSAHERRVRQIRYQERFRQLSIADQERLKGRLAVRDARRGLDPGRRHDLWLRAQGDDLRQRAAERAEDFARLPRPEQVALVQSWERHRRRFGIRRGEAPLYRLERELVAASGPADAEAVWAQLAFPEAVRLASAIGL